MRVACTCARAGGRRVVVPCRRCRPDRSHPQRRLDEGARAGASDRQCSPGFGGVPRPCDRGVREVVEPGNRICGRRSTKRLPFDGPRRGAVATLRGARVAVGTDRWRQRTTRRSDGWRRRDHARRAPRRRAGLLRGAVRGRADTALRDRREAGASRIRRRRSAVSRRRHPGARREPCPRILGAGSSRAAGWRGPASGGARHAEDPAPDSGRDRRARESGAESATGRCVVEAVRRRAA